MNILSSLTLFGLINNMNQLGRATTTNINLKDLKVSDLNLVWYRSALSTQPTILTSENNQIDSVQVPLSTVEDINFFNNLRSKLCRLEVNDVSDNFNIFVNINNLTIIQVHPRNPILRFANDNIFGLEQESRVQSILNNKKNFFIETVFKGFHDNDKDFKVYVNVSHINQLNAAIDADGKRMSIIHLNKGANYRCCDSEDIMWDKISLAKKNKVIMDSL